MVDVREMNDGDIGYGLERKRIRSQPMVLRHSSALSWQSNYRLLGQIDNHLTGQVTWMETRAVGMGNAGRFQVTANDGSSGPSAFRRVSLSLNDFSDRISPCFLQPYSER